MSLLVVKAYEHSSQSGAMELVLATALNYKIITLLNTCLYRVTRSLKDLVKRSSFVPIE